MKNLFDFLFTARWDYPLSCPQCQEQGIMNVKKGSKGIVTDWNFSCAACGKIANGKFSFFEKLIICIIMLIPFGCILFAFEKILPLFPQSYYLFLTIFLFFCMIILGSVFALGYIKIRLKSFIGRASE